MYSSTRTDAVGITKHNQHENEVKHNHSEANTIHGHVANQVLTIISNLKNATRLIEAGNLKWNIIT